MAVKSVINVLLLLDNSSLQYIKYMYIIALLYFQRSSSDITGTVIVFLTHIDLRAVHLVDIATFIEHNININTSPKCTLYILHVSDSSH